MYWEYIISHIKQIISVLVLIRHLFGDSGLLIHIWIDSKPQTLKNKCIEEAKICCSRIKYE